MIAIVEAQIAFTSMQALCVNNLYRSAMTSKYSAST
jgi:hypothetical protein